MNGSEPYRSARLLSISLLAISLIVAISAGCDKKETTVPVTTSSEIAREQFLKGSDYSDNLRAAEARGYFEKAIEADPDFAMAHLLLAFAQTTQQDFLATLAEATARTKFVSEGEQLIIKAVEAGVNGDPELQGELLTKLISRYPLDKRAHLAYANFLFGQQQYQKAISEYRKTNQLDPYFSLPYNMAGYSHRRLGRYKQAEESFLKYIQLIPNDPNPYDSYAELLMKMGEFQESIESYHKALAIDSNFFASRIGIASNLVHLNRHDEARLEIQTMYDLAPDDGTRRNAMLNMALIYIDEGDYDGGQAVLQRRLSMAVALGDSGTVANDLTLIGLLEVEQGQFAKAGKSFERRAQAVEASNLSEILKQNSRRVQLFARTVLAFEQGDIETSSGLADEYFAKAETAHNPLLVMAAYQLKGRLAMAEKKWEEAISFLSKSNQQNPYNLYRLAIAYQAAGQLSKAKARAREAAEFNQFLEANYAMIRQRAVKLYKSMK